MSTLKILQRSKSVHMIIATDYIVLDNSISLFIHHLFLPTSSPQLIIFKIKIDLIAIRSRCVELSHNRVVYLSDFLLPVNIVFLLRIGAIIDQVKRILD